VDPFKNLVLLWPEFSRTSDACEQRPGKFDPTTRFVVGKCDQDGYWKSTNTCVEAGKELATYTSVMLSAKVCMDICDLRGPDCGGFDYGSRPKTRLFEGEKLLSSCTLYERKGLIFDPCEEKCVPDWSGEELLNCETVTISMEGKRGDERVHLRAPGLDKKYTLRTKQHVTFQKGDFEIEFLNDGSGRDVTLESKNEDFEDISHPADKDFPWKCGKNFKPDCRGLGFLKTCVNKENDRCKRVRNGHLDWKGTYKVKPGPSRETMSIFLTGVTGEEQVRVKDAEYCERAPCAYLGNNVYYLQFRGKETEIVVPKPRADRPLVLDFINDDGTRRDVVLRSDEKLEIVSAHGEEKNWNCEGKGKRVDKERCGLVSKGRLHWRGKYYITLAKGPEPVNFYEKHSVPTGKKCRDHSDFVEILFSHLRTSGNPWERETPIRDNCQQTSRRFKETQCTGGICRDVWI